MICSKKKKLGDFLVLALMWPWCRWNVAMFVMVSSPSVVGLEGMRLVSVLQHLAGTSAGTTAPGHDPYG